MKTGDSDAGIAHDARVLQRLFLHTPVVMSAMSSGTMQESAEISDSLSGSRARDAAGAHGPHEYLHGFLEHRIDPYISSDSTFKGL